MMKKLLLGTFIVYNIFATSAFTYVANAEYFKAESEQKESSIVEDKVKDSFNPTPTKDLKEDSTDLKDQKVKDEKNGGGISIATSDLNSSEGCDSTGTPNITVLSPNGGEVYQAGQQITVKWASCGIAVNTLLEINIYSSSPQSFGFLAPNGTPNDGVETITLSNDLSSGSNYTIIVGVPLAGLNNSALLISDQSDAPFTIGSITNPSVTVVSPNGGEVYQAGQTINITWTASGMDPNTAASIILHSLNPAGGTGIGAAPVGGPSGSSFSYVIPNYPSGDYEIIVQAVDNSNNTIAIDSSDTPFTIGSVTYPAGCTSALGYSYTTGIPCTNPVTWLAGCTSANGYSVTTGQPCNWTVVYPNVPQGCIPNQGGYSVTTGQPCFGITISFCDPNNSTTVPAVDVMSPNGGEHYLPADISVTWRTCQIPADSQMKIDLVMQNPNSTTTVRNITTTINDGTQVVLLPNTTTWPEMIYGNNFKVRIYPVNSPSYGPLDQSNQSFSIAPARLIISTAIDTPPTRIVEVDNVSSTEDVVLLRGNFTTENSDVLLKDIPFTFTTIGGVNVASVAESVSLYIDGNEVANELVSPNSTTTQTVLFENLYVHLNDGDTHSFRVQADINDIEPGLFNEGDTLEAYMTEIDRDNTNVQDENGDALSNSQKIGTAIGNPQIFRTRGVVVNTVSTAQMITDIDENGNTTAVTFIVVLDVTAFGQDAYIGNTAQLATSATGTNAISYVFENFNNPTFPDVTSGAVSNFSSNTGDYSIEEGNTNRFTLTTILLTPSIPDSFYRLALKDIRMFDNSSLTTGALNISLLPPDSYRTSYIFFNN